MDLHPGPGDKHRLLENNYQYLFDLYRLGRFEKAVEPAWFQFYRPAIGEVSAGQPARRGQPARTLKPAADDLYALACDIDADASADAGQFTPGERERVAELVLRAKVLSYEIDDYFLTIDSTKSGDFVRRSKEICDDLPGYVAKHYAFVSDPERQKSVVQYLLLTALCGINELYRQHNKDDYREGIERAQRVLSYVRNHLPRLPAPPASGMGVLGLCCYIMGRLNFALGYYRTADSFFRESVEAYSERIQANPGDSLESILATVRRCALASTFGNAYIALMDGKVRDAITLSALACSVLKHNCGEVYAAYAELIYWDAKRAAASSDEQSLHKVRRGLRRCRRVFNLYVPNTHYVHRAGIQLGIAYHYLAQANPRRRERYYNLATAHLTQAITFAEAEVNGRPRNQRMLAEALTVLSHITIHCDADQVSTALRQAERALSAAEGIRQFICEANLALGAIYHTAARKCPSAEQRAEYVMGARLHTNKALEINEDTNSRIRAACYLRLAELSLLQPNTVPEVRHYYEKWLLVKDSVEHDFLQQWGEQIRSEMLNVTEHLFIDVTDSLKYKGWKNRVEEHLAHAAMRELARELRVGQAGTPGEGQQAQTKKKTSRRLSSKTLIREFLMRKLEIERSAAYEWIRNYKLEENLREYGY